MALLDIPRLTIPFESVDHLAHNHLRREPINILHGAVVAEAGSEGPVSFNYALSNSCALLLVNALKNQKLAVSITDPKPFVSSSDLVDINVVGRAETGRFTPRSAAFSSWFPSEGQGNYSEDHVRVVVQKITLVFFAIGGILFPTIMKGWPD